MKTEVEIAQEVMAGKWGTGKERETKIRKAGYDYNAVQAYVNRMIETGKPIKEVTISKKDYSGMVIYVEV